MSKNLEYKGYTAKITYSYEDELFYGTINGIIDLVTFEGTSVSELKQAFYEAVDDYLDICARYGKEPNKEYKGSFNVRILPDLHRKAAIEASKLDISLNQLIENAVAKYLEHDANHVKSINIYYTQTTQASEKKSVQDLWQTNEANLKLGIASKKGVCVQ